MQCGRPPVGPSSVLCPNCQLKANKAQNETLPLPVIRLQAPVQTWSDTTIINEIRWGTILDKARLELASVVEKVLKALELDFSAIELRRIEFEGVVGIAKALGIKIVYENPISSYGDITK